MLLVHNRQMTGSFQSLQNSWITADLFYNTVLEKMPWLPSPEQAHCLPHHWVTICLSSKWFSNLDTKLSKTLSQECFKQQTAIAWTTIAIPSDSLSAGSKKCLTISLGSTFLRSSRDKLSASLSTLLTNSLYCLARIGNWELGTPKYPVWES